MTGLACACLAVVCLAACTSRDEAPVPVTRLDDPRLIGGEPDGDQLLSVRLNMDEEARWNDYRKANGTSLLGAARLGPDIVKAYVSYRRGPDRDVATETAYAVDCRARRMRLLGTGTLADADSGVGASAAVTAIPRSGAEAVIFDKLCDNRFRCELRDIDNPCNYEQTLSIERAGRRNAVEDAQ